MLTIGRLEGLRAANQLDMSELVLRRNQMRETLRAPRHEAGEMRLRYTGRCGGQISSWLCRYLVACVHMSHQGFPVIPSKLSGCARASNLGEIPTGRRPTGTCITDVSKRSTKSWHLDLTFRRLFSRAPQSPIPYLPFSIFS